MGTSGAFLVSGGASGLGAAAAKSLGAAGWHVAILDISEADAEDLPDNASSYICDVTDAEAVRTLVEQITAERGPVFGLLCCAGIAPSAKLVGRNGPHDFDLFHKVLMVNVAGTFNLMRAAAAQMKSNAPDSRGQRGVIINTASTAAYEGQIGQIAYAASKGAVASMTLPAARELAASGIRVLSIAPGVFDTPMMQAMPDTVRESIAATVPFPSELGNPDDFGVLVRHLAENPTLNGEVIRLDGALRMSAK